MTICNDAGRTASRRASRQRSGLPDALDQAAEPALFLQGQGTPVVRFPV